MLVICWSSTRTVVQEALTRLGRKDIAMLHFAQVWPVHPKLAEYTNRTKKAICTVTDRVVPVSAFSSLPQTSNDQKTV